MRHALWSNVAQYVGGPTDPQFLADLDHCVALKMHGVRLDCVPGYTNMGADLSQVIARAQAAHDRGLAVLLMCPHWEKDKTQVADYAGLGKFAGLVVNSPLQTLAAAIEMGNEPGSPPFTGGQKPNPLFQAKVTEAFIDGGFGGWHGKLVTPGLAPVAGGGYVEIDTFIDAYWSALGASYQARIDSAGVHLYSAAKTSDSAYFKSWAMLDGLHATTGKKLWVTECNVLGESGVQRATDFTLGLNTLAARSDVANTFLYEMSDQGGGDVGYGAYSPSGVATPLVGALQAWAAA